MVVYYNVQFSPLDTVGDAAFEPELVCKNIKIIIMDQKRDIVFSYLKLIFHTTCKDSCCTKSALRKWYYSLLNTALDWTEEHGICLIKHLYIFLENTVY